MRVARRPSTPGESSRPSKKSDFRRTISPLLCTAALGVGYVLLTRLVPQLRTNLESVPQTIDSHWTAPIWSLSATVEQSRSVVLGVVVLAAAVAVLFTVLSRTAAAAVYLVGVLLCAFDLVVFFGAMTYFYREFLDKAL